MAYPTNYKVDLDNAVIVDVAPTVPIRPAETLAARRMIDRVHDRFGLKPDKLVGDTGYGSAEMLGWLVEDRRIAPHIPVLDKSKRTECTFSREDFAYDALAVACPRHVAFQHLSFVIHGPPEIVPLAVDLHEHLVEVPTPSA